MTLQEELRDLNRIAWQNGKTDHVLPKNLDSNMKKNTAFIKKCKSSFTPETRSQLLNDIKKLSLEKYISEIVSSCMEGFLKCKTSAEIGVCAEVMSALHQRFPYTFTRLLTFSLAKALQPPVRQQLDKLPADQREKEEAARISRQRTYLCVATELWIVGVIRYAEDGIQSLATGSLDGVDTQRESIAGLTGSTSTGAKKTKDVDKNKTTEFVYRALKNLLASDMDHHVNLPLVSSFLKNYGEQVVGTVPRKRRAAMKLREDEEGEDKTPMPTAGAEVSNSAVAPETRAAIKELVTAYYSSVEKHLIKEHKFIKKMDHRRNEALFARGELSEERKQQFEKATKAYEKFLNNTQALADALDIEMPELPEEEDGAKSTIISAGSTNTFANVKDNLGNGIWEDEDARKFYEDIPDLRILVPGCFIEASNHRESEVQKDDADRENTVVPEPTESAESDSHVQPEEEHLGKLDVEGDEFSLDAEPEDEEESDIALADSIDADGDDMDSQRDQQTLKALCSRLPLLANRDMIDDAAREYCYLDSKSSRKRIAATLLEVPRQRVDLLPYYSRLTATLNIRFPAIGETVVKGLLNSFKRLRRKKPSELLETRVLNIRFLSELTKFKVAPPHVIFYAFKVALDDFTHNNIDVVCNLLETCGRYLLRSPDTHDRMAAMLETVMKKKVVQRLDSRQAMMVENAFYQANPPEKPAIVKKERSPMELYIRKLTYTDLSKKSLDKILKQLRKLHWEDPAVVHILTKIFQKVWKIKYSNIHLLAILVNGLARYHSEFGMQIVDGVVEEIRTGLEQNIFKHNQRRIAVAKYLGEMYNYRTVDSPLIFDTLYTIVTLGHEFGRPARERPCLIDAPTDFFRIRLCCTLLETCGMCFDRGSSKRKLDHFLTFFQMYILSKAKPTIDVDFMISDTFEMLRPQMHVFSSYEEANEAVDAMLLEQLSSVQGTDGKAMPDGFEDSESQESSSDENDEEEALIEEEGEGSVDDTVDAGASGEDEDVVVMKKKKAEQISQEEDAEFEMELSKLMSESADLSKMKKKQSVFDKPIPMNIRSNQDRKTAALQNNPGGENNMAFRLLTRKNNNNSKFVEMNVPVDSHLAKNMRMNQKAEQEEKQRLKEMVLKYEQQTEDAVRKAAMEERDRQRSGYRGKSVLHFGGGGGNMYSSQHDRRG